MSAEVGGEAQERGSAKVLVAELGIHAEANFERFAQNDTAPDHGVHCIVVKDRGRCVVFRAALAGNERVATARIERSPAAAGVRDGRERSREEEPVPKPEREVRTDAAAERVAAATPKVLVVAVEQRAVRHVAAAPPLSVARAGERHEASSE